MGPICPETPGGRKGISRVVAIWLGASGLEMIGAKLPFSFRQRLALLAADFS